MKKFLSSLFAIVAVVALALTVAGCAAKVSGKTYVYEEIQIDIPSDASDLQVAAIDLAKEALAKTVKDVKYTFNEDGTTSAGGTWKQDGNTVTVTVMGQDTQLKVSGKKLKSNTKYGNYEFTVVFVQQ